MVNENSLDYCIISNPNTFNTFNTLNPAEINGAEIKTIELGNGVTITYPNIEINPFFINSIFLLMGILVGVSISTLIVSLKK